MIYIYLVLLFATVVTSQTNDTLDVCWRDTYCRGVGTIPTTCPEGKENNAGLCYPLCKEGYYGVGPVCWENCPPNFTDIGALCTIPTDIYFPCPWYDICGLTFAKGCMHNCSEGYHNDGCSCRRPAVVIAKKTYGRGVGSLPGCSKAEQEDAGLCYDSCKVDYIGVGPVCWRNSSGNASFAIECNPVAYGHTELDCEDLNSLLKEAGITSVVCIGSLAASIITGHVVGPKICRNLITQVLPKLAHTPIC